LLVAIQSRMGSDTSVASQDLRGYNDMLETWQQGKSDGEIKDALNLLIEQINQGDESLKASTQDPPDEEGKLKVLTQDKNIGEDLQNLLVQKSGDEKGTPFLLKEEKSKAVDLQEITKQSQRDITKYSDSKLQEQMDSVTKNERDKKMTLLREKLFNLVSDSHNSQNQEDILTRAEPASASNIMAKLKALSQGLENQTVVIEPAKGSGKSDNHSMEKMLKNTPMDDDAVRNMLKNPSSEFQKNYDSENQLFTEKRSHRPDTSSEFLDTFRIPRQEPAELSPMMKNSGGQEILSQSAKATNSGTFIQNLNTIKMEMNKEIAKMGEKEKSTLTVRLQPEELGRMKIDLELKEGMIHGKIFVENESAKNALQQNLQAMRDQMKDQGISVGSLEVELGNESSQEFQNQQETLKEPQLPYWMRGNQYAIRDDEYIPGVDHNSSMVNRFNALA